MSKDVKTYYKKCPKCSEINGKESKWCLQCGKAISSVEVCRYDSSTELQGSEKISTLPDISRNEAYSKDQLQASFKNLHIVQYPAQNNVNFIDSSTYGPNCHFQDFNQENGANMQGFMNAFNVGHFPPLPPLLDPVCPIFQLDDLRCLLPANNLFDCQQLLGGMVQKNKSTFLKYKKRPFPRNILKYKKWDRRTKNPLVQPSKENKSTIMKLPEETILYVFSFLSLQELTTCARVCKHFQRIALDESLWKVIAFRKSHNLTDDILQKVAHKHPTSLAISYCNVKNVTLQGFCALLQVCSETLEELIISGNSGSAFIGDVFLIHVSTRCNNIQSLDVSWSNVGNKGVKSISQASRKLFQVSLNGCQTITDQSIKAIAEKHFDYLQILEVFGCFNITQTSINLISCKCKEIRVLNLGQCHKVKNSSLCAIAKGLHKLECLDIRGCKLIRDCALREIIVHCPFLSNLVIANCPSITDATLFTLASLCPQLRSLDVCGIGKISDHGVETLTKSCRTLASLDISSTKATGRSVLTIALYCRQFLESLKLSFCQGITEVSLDALINNCKKLKCLHVYGCQPLTNLGKLMEINPKLTIEK